MMKKIIKMPGGKAFHSLLALSALTSVLAGCSKADIPAQADDVFVAEAEAVTARFQSELQQALSAAMTETGPVGAIGVCQSAAPAIAQNLSEESGFSVSRIARKNRNPEGSVSGGLDRLYAELEATPTVNGKPNAVHAQLGSGQVFMRAIPMQEQPCAACHGTNIAPEVKAAIEQAYPEDLATGFQPGELRGAFLVESSTPMDK